MSKRTIVAAALTAAVSSTVARPEVPAHPDAVAPIVAAVTPIVENAVNAEPVYRSKVVIGSIAGILSGGISLIGLIQAGVTDPNLYAPLIAGIIGSGLALYGRLISARPLGQ